MKEIDVSPGFISQHQMPDPAVYEAQRMAELKNMALYREKHKEAYKEWSSPEAIKIRQEEHAKAAKDAEVRVIKIAPLEPKNINEKVRLLAEETKPGFLARIKYAFKGEW
jgi:regulator of sirC expression with transglutaminase-like and TPR domain